MPAIRRFVESDFDSVVGRWHQTNRESYPYVAEHQRHTLADASAFFRNRVLVECEVWVAERNGALAGVLAVEPPWIRHIAVFSEHRRQGIGTALLRKARERSPREIRL